MKRFILLLITTSVFIPSVFIPSVADAYIPSPRYGAFELKIGPYSPNIDESTGLDAGDITQTCNGELPYNCFFNNDTMANATIELDWQFARIPNIVSFAIAGSFGYMKSESDNVTTLGEDTADYTKLNIIPFAALAVIRFDVLADMLGIPFVPYFKTGFNWYVWWIRDSGKTTAASGGTIGWQMNPGIALRLDAFDKMSSRTFDNEIGVNHSYIFFEILYANAEGLGKSNRMHLSPTDLANHVTWQMGLALEF